MATFEDWYIAQAQKLQGLIDEKRDVRNKLSKALADVGIVFNEDGTFERKEGTPLTKEEIERIRIYIDMTLKEESFLSDRILGKATINIKKSEVDGILLEDMIPNDGE